MITAGIEPRPIPSPPPEWASFSIGPVTIHTYAICILVGMIAAIIWTNHRLTKRGAEEWIILDAAIVAVPLGLLGARLYHVFTHPADYFYDRADPWRIFYIWEGGNAIIGALIGGAIGLAIACRLAGLRFLSVTDAIVPGLLLAQAVGRTGNWFNHELFGAPTDLPWGLEIEATNPAFPAGLEPGTLFHPTFLYEMLWNLLGVAVILLFERMFRMRWGRATALYLIWYGLGRMVIESIRVDYSEIVLGMRSNVLGALILVLIGVLLWLVQSKRHPELELSVYRDGHDPSEIDDEDEAEGQTESHRGDEREADTANTEKAGVKSARGATKTTPTTR